MNPPEQWGRWPEAQQTMPEPLNQLDEFEVEELVVLMREPVRAVHKCITKHQLKTLCMQLLARNLALQHQVKKLREVLK
jgi:hypothetical protein